MKIQQLFIIKNLPGEQQFCGKAVLRTPTDGISFGYTFFNN